MQLLKQSTSVDVRIGPFVDVGDGYTPETGVSLSSADEAELLKHNGAAAVDISSNTWSAVTNCDGWYDLTLTTGNTDTLGLLEIVVQDDSVCLPVHARFMVVTANVWDSLFGADTLQADVTQISGSAVDTSAAQLGVNAVQVSGSATAAGNVEVVFDTDFATAYSTTNDKWQTEANVLQVEGADATDQINAACDTALTDYDAVVPGDLPSNFADLSITATTGRVDVASIEGADATDQIRDAVVDDATRIDASALNTLSGHDPGATLSSLTAADVDTEVDQAIENYHLDHLLAVTYDPASKPGAADALLNELVEDDSGVARFTQNSLEQAPGGGTTTNLEIKHSTWSVDS